MGNWALVLASLAIGGALLAVTMVGRRYDRLLARYLGLRESRERLRLHALDLSGQVRALERELEAAQIQAERVPGLMGQIKDRDGEIERLNSRGGKVVLFPRGGSKTSDAAGSGDEWYHDALIFPADQASAESGDDEPAPDPEREPKTNR